MSLSSRIVPVREVSEGQKAEMWALFSRLYADTGRDQFLGDLAAKERVILLFDHHGKIQGFSTLVRWSATLRGRRATVVFSGDTVVDPKFWGQTALQVAFTRYVLSTWLQNPFQPTLWLLISKGWKTYLLLTRFFVRYWPRFDQPTPPEMAELIDHIATRQWPVAWQKDKGILHFPSSHGRLKEQVAPITPELLQDPDIRFFASQNPEHPSGDELVCIGQVGLDFAARTLWRVVSRPFRPRRVR